MATTAIADIIDPEVLADQASAKYPDQLVFGNTNLVQIDTEIPLGSPGTHFKLPFWMKIAPFAAVVEGTAMTPSKVQAKAEYAVVERGGGAHEVYDTAQLVSKSDPVSEIATQVARRAAEYVDSSIVTKAFKTPNVLNYTAVGGGTVDQNALVRAMFTLGDNAAKLQAGGMIIMHSKVMSDLLQLGFIQNQYQSGLNFAQNGMVSTILGLPIIPSDLLPVDTTTDVNNPHYTTLLVAPGALSLMYQRQVMVEFDRDIFLQADAMATTVHFATHLNGWDDLTNAIAAEEAKSIRCVRLITK